MKNNNGKWWEGHAVCFDDSVDIPGVTTALLPRPVAGVDGDLVAMAARSAERCKDAVLSSLATTVVLTVLTASACFWHTVDYTNVWALFAVIFASMLLGASLLTTSAAIDTLQVSADRIKRLTSRNIECDGRKAGSKFNTRKDNYAKD
jgi:hypothetical protein